MSACGDEISGSFKLTSGLSNTTAILKTCASLEKQSMYFHVTRLGQYQSPILVVTAEGVFNWASDAESRLVLDDFENHESLRHVLLALWNRKT